MTKYIKKYIEFGIGNRWLIRTEFESLDGAEYEVRGVSGKIKPKLYYLRLWLGQSVLILDSKEGTKRQRKKRKALKVIFGIASRV